MRVPNCGFHLIIDLWPGRCRDCDQMALSAEEERSLRDRRGGHADLAHRVHGEQLELWACLDDVDVAVLAREIELPLCGNGRGGEAAPARYKALLVERVAGL